MEKQVTTLVVKMVNENMNFGIPKSGLSKSLIEPITNYLLAKNCKIFTGCEVTSIKIDTEKERGVYYYDGSDLNFFSADIIVLAVTPIQAKKVIDRFVTAGFSPVVYALLLSGRFSIGIGFYNNLLHFQIEKFENMRKKVVKEPFIPKVTTYKYGLLNKYIDHDNILNTNTILCECM